MTLTEEIGAKIKYYRKKRGMKIVELAALLHQDRGHRIQVRKRADRHGRGDAV